MGQGTKDKRLLLKIRAADTARRIKYLHEGHARSRSALLCSELFPPVSLSARYQGNFSSGIVAPSRKEKTHRHIQGRRAVGRCVRKAAQDQDAQPVIPAKVRSQGKMSAFGR